MDVVNLGKQIKQALIEFKLELEATDVIVAARVDYKFELNSDGLIKDRFIIECWHQDAEDDSDKEYKIKFSTKSHNILTDFSKEAILEIIKNVMSQSTKKDAINTLDLINDKSYSGLEIATDARKVRIIANKAGGNASKDSYNYKVSIPTAWAKELGITPENRDLEISLDSDKIIIRKL
jgi:hypothetical protein